MTEATEAKRRRWWAFDRPLLRDSLFWLALAAGVILAVVRTSSAQFSEVPLIAQTASFVGRLLIGFFLAAALGGAARNFWRGYREG